MILCCGEALIDMIPMTGADGVRGFQPLAGGAVFNTAIALGRLEKPAGFFFGLSTDLFGRQLRATLESSKVDHSLCVSSARPTTLAFVELNDGQASYTFYDEMSAGRMLTAERLPSIPAEVSTLFFGGISLINEPCAATLAYLQKREARDRVIMLDPNIRTGFISDTKAYRKRINAMIALSDIVKVSDEDLSWLVPGEGTLEHKCRMLQRTGPSLIVVTRGGDEVTALMSDGERVSARPKRVKVADTVGAGDTFNAGLLAKLSDLGVLTKPGIAEIDAALLKAALAFGTEVAAVTVSRSGADAPWLHELSAGAKA